MNLPKLATCVYLIFLLLVLLSLTNISFSQSKMDTAKKTIDFKGSISVTNNGFSVIPSFTLGKPATVMLFAIGGKKFSFEPELRFSLQAKPWSFLFWFRYKIIKKDRFSMGVGVHPALNFRTDPAFINGIAQDVTIARRYFAAEIAPSYQLAKSIGISAYYLHSFGLDNGTIGNTDFLTFRTHFSNIKLSKTVFLQFNPQVFYLKMDERDGFYATSTLTLAKKDFPFSISSIMNKAIRSNIVSKDFDWNISIIYAFDKKFIR
ncbi:MAG: hypothetical protein MUE81_12080 [Thermoflexibacter sp.]|nr:hypothetical protein [Thermoflexibacter sp.]